MEKGNRIVEKLREVIGEGLAVVGRVDAERDPPEYDHFYLRDDIREMYDDEEMENISHEAVLTILEKSHRDSLFKYGDFQYLVLGFEEKTTVVVYEDDRKGLTVVMDSDSGVHPDEVARNCIDILDGRA